MNAYRLCGVQKRGCLAVRWTTSFILGNAQWCTSRAPLFSCEDGVVNVEVVPRRHPRKESNTHIPRREARRSSLGHELVVNVELIRFTYRYNPQHVVSTWDNGCGRSPILPCNTAPTATRIDPVLPCVVISKVHRSIRCVSEDDLVRAI